MAKVLKLTRNIGILCGPDDIYNIHRLGKYVGEEKAKTMRFGIRGYVPDLTGYGIDNDIESATQTGLWMYYENADYNPESASVFMVHGINISINFPPEYANIVTAIRYAGEATLPNADTITLYQGTAFTGEQLFAVTDAGSITILDADASSFIITGLSPWTLYTETSYAGESYCVYPDTDHDVSPEGDQLDFGIYPDITSLGIPDDAIRSLRKGCFGNEVMNATPLKYDGKAENGAWRLIYIFNIIKCITHRKCYSHF
ncbi:hypothetical protein SK128_027949 [Halocaridina rubra]|uniref:Uncharacterized protein n=1 Tax=Halocaridina rubra TaxID=373956 RepID=A0AAN8XGD4_HALRR